MIMMSGENSYGRKGIDVRLFVLVLFHNIIMINILKFEPVTFFINIFYFYEALISYFFGLMTRL